LPLNSLIKNLQIVGGTVMLGDTLGILLSKREWNKLKHSKIDENSCYYQYVKNGEHLNLEVVFIPISNISIIEGKTEALVIKNNLLTYKGMVDIPSVIYNPTKFNRKKNIKTLRELSLHPHTQVINEHHVMKEKYVFDIIQSRFEIEKYRLSEQVEPHLTFYMLGQKNASHQWNVSLLYAIDAEQKMYSIEDVWSLHD